MVGVRAVDAWMRKVEDNEGYTSFDAKLKADLPHAECLSWEVLKA